MNTSWYLHWEGPLHPYVRTTQRQKFCDPRYKKYQAFKVAFRAYANTQGWPEGLDKDKRYRLILNIYLTGAARYDLDNGIKAVMDSLFAQDRRIVEIWASLHEHKDEEAATVTLEVIQ